MSRCVNYVWLCYVLVLFVSGGWYSSCSDTRSLFTRHWRWCQIPRGCLLPPQWLAWGRQSLLQFPTLSISKFKLLSFTILFFNYGLEYAMCRLVAYSISLEMQLEVMSFGDELETLLHFAYHRHAVFHAMTKVCSPLKSSQPSLWGWWRWRMMKSAKFLEIKLSPMSIGFEYFVLSAMSIFLSLSLHACPASPLLMLLNLVSNLMVTWSSLESPMLVWRWLKNPRLLSPRNWEYMTFVFR